jgi:dihydrofolate synthase/folylpolyglutamate synthase
LREPAWPGRLDLRRLADGREILLDAAHNPAGASALASYLKDSGFSASFTGRPPLVFAAMRDKEVDAMLRELLPAVGPVFVTRASTPRSADAEELAARVRALAPGTAIRVASTVSDALAAAWRLSPRIVAAGSIFLLGDVIREIAAS